MWPADTVFAHLGAQCARLESQQNAYIESFNGLTDKLQSDIDHDYIKNILLRLDKAILLAREHLFRYPTEAETKDQSFKKDILYGDTDEDIQDIWNTIRGPLSTTNDRAYEEGHPPVDRLFDIAFDINSAAQLTIEGEIDPTAICAVYALKTAEYAKTAGDQVSACLSCIDAWRALAFIPRAEYLGEKMALLLRAKTSRSSNIDKAQQKNKQNRAFTRRSLIIKREFDKLTDHLKYEKEPEEVAKLIIRKIRNNKHAAKINTLHSTNLKGFDHDRIAKKIKRVTEAIKRFQSERISRDLSHNISKQTISLDQSPCWPERKPI